MQELDQRKYERRASDHKSQDPTLSDIWQKLIEIQQRQIEYSSAFVLNDLNKPDFDGHRQEHKALKEANKVLDGYKIEATKKFINIVIGGLCTLVGLGALQWFQSKF